MVDEPFRLRVLKAFTEWLKGITPENGYMSDLSASVLRGRTMFGSADPLPMVSILEDPKQDIPSVPGSDSTVQKSNWSLLIQGFGKDDLVNPTDPVHFLCSDVQTAIGRLRQEQYRQILGFSGTNRVIDIKFGQPVVRPAEQGVSDKAYFWLRVSLVIVEDLANPYT